jgi:hypothetical protein
MSRPVLRVPVITRGQLPFTGFSLWLVLLSALALAAMGLGLRAVPKGVLLS